MPATGKVLNEAIELLNMENYAGAKQKIGTLNLEKLSPYERSKVEQILFNIAVPEEKYDEARRHLKTAIDAGGFNEQEISQARYQYAQLFMQEEKWKEGAAALEEWFKTATNPNSAAYYLLAVAYYQMDDYNKGVGARAKSRGAHGQAAGGLAAAAARSVPRGGAAPGRDPASRALDRARADKKTYWMQLSSVYGHMEDYPKALAVMQLAYSAGLVTEDGEIRRLADLLLFNDVPYRGANVLETAIENKTVKVDDKLYEKLANCWIAAAEYDEPFLRCSVPPNCRARAIYSCASARCKFSARIGKAAIAALQRGLDKGQLKDTGSAQMMMGLALFNQKNFREAREWFNRSRTSEKHRKLSNDYIELIDAQG